MVKSITIAIPNSALINYYHIRDKTERIGAIARSCAIFKVTEIIIYNDTTLGLKKSEFENRFLKQLLSYIETPQYLRKKLFPHHQNLQYAGLLPPLATPHHPADSPLQDKQFREGAVYLNKDKKVVVNIGTKNPIEMLNPPPESLTKRNIRVTTIIHKQKNDTFLAEIVSRETAMAKRYWGYKVKVTPQSLIKLGKRVKNNNNLVFATSKNGMPYYELDAIFNTPDKGKITSKPLVFIFGSPQRGLLQLLKDTGGKIKDISHYNINAIPNPGTRSVRLEEALSITLARVLSKLEH